MAQSGPKDVMVQQRWPPKKGALQVTVKEDHHGTRQRYTILTFVQSWMTVGGTPPKCALLFKADDGARMRHGLELPPWMLLQFQDKGSYRTSDVIDVLRWGLDMQHDHKTVSLCSWTGILRIWLQTCRTRYNQWDMWCCIMAEV